MTATEELKLVKRKRHSALCARVTFAQKRSLVELGYSARRSYEEHESGAIHELSYGYGNLDRAEAHVVAMEKIVGVVKGDLGNDARARIAAMQARLPR